MSSLAALTSGVGYLARRPLTLIGMARHAIGMRVAIPLDLLRWLITRRTAGKAAIADVEIGTRSPAVTFAATVDLMGARLRAGASITIDELTLGPDELKIAIRVGDLELRALDGEMSPLGQLLKSGAIDPKKPANLLNFAPKRPPVLVDAKDDRFVIDLMKSPKLAANARLRAILATFKPIVSIHEVRAEGDQLLIGWAPHPTGLPAAILALVSALR